MPGRRCAMTNCSNTDIQLRQWGAEQCQQHQMQRKNCTCPWPFQLRPFPSATREPALLEKWTRTVQMHHKYSRSQNQKWEPTKNSRLCSKHFVPGGTFPTLALGGDTKIHSKPPVKERRPGSRNNDSTPAAPSSPAAEPTSSPSTPARPPKLNLSDLAAAASRVRKRKQSTSSARSLLGAALTLPLPAPARPPRRNLSDLAAVACKNRKVSTSPAPSSPAPSSPVAKPASPPSPHAAEPSPSSAAEPSPSAAESTSPPPSSQLSAPTLDHGYAYHNHSACRAQGLCTCCAVKDKLVLQARLSLSNVTEELTSVTEQLTNVTEQLSLAQTKLKEAEDKVKEGERLKEQLALAETKLKESEDKVKKVKVDQLANVSLAQQLSLAQSKLKVAQDKLKAGEGSMWETCVMSDASVQRSTGLPTKDVFDRVFTALQPRAESMRYWYGAKKMAGCLGSSPRQFKGIPKKSGPQRKLSLKAEFLMTMVKFRQGFGIEFMGVLFGVSATTCSSIVTSWVKLLTEELRDLVSWPDFIATRLAIPKAIPLPDNPPDVY